MRVDETQRQIVRLVLERERTLEGLERLLGSGAVAAGCSRPMAVVIRHGERLWASPGSCGWTRWVWSSTTWAYCPKTRNPCSVLPAMARKRNRSARSRRLARSVQTRVPMADGCLPESWCKEELSIAYAHAVATAIGVTCESPKRDINGWDVLFRARDTEMRDGAQLAVQLKCTVARLTRVAGGRELSFPLDRDDYDNLRRQPTHPPRLLVVVEVPHSMASRCVDVSSQQLLLRASAWYATLAGEPPLADGQGSRAVRIPITQRFNPRSLHANMRSCP